MKRTIVYEIRPEWEGYSIEKLLRLKGYTKQSLIELKRMDRNLVIDGEWVYLNRKLKAGECLSVNIVETDISEKIPPVEHDFGIAYEDEDIIVVDKPPFMPIHPSLNNYENTLGNALAYYYRNNNEDFVFRCINRLDRDTSGLTIVAKHQVAAGILYKAMAERQIHREYIAVVENPNGDLEESATIDLPIGRKGGSSIERMVDYDNGERAVTHYQLIDSRDGLSLIKLKLDTGRTHQIRVHMTYIGHPLIGDWLYNSKDTRMKRQALHSYSLMFKHPITGEDMKFISDLPNDFPKEFVDII